MVAIRVEETLRKQIGRCAVLQAVRLVGKGLRNLGRPQILIWMWSMTISLSKKGLFQKRGTLKTACLFFWRVFPRDSPTGVLTSKLLRF